MKEYLFNRFLITGLLCFAILLAGCEKKLENFDFLKSEPKLVVNAPFTSDSSMIFHVSKTIGIMESNRFAYVNNSVAELWSDNNLVETANYIDSGYYSFDYLPLAGESLSLIVEAPGFPAVSSEIKMPAVPGPLSVEFIGKTDFGHSFKLILDDPGDTKNFYGISLWTQQGWVEYDEFGPVDTIITGMVPQYLSSSNISIVASLNYYSLSSDNWDDYYSGTTLLIDDSYINGKELSVDFGCYDIISAVIIGSPLIFVIESFDESYIKYLYSMEMYHNSNGNPIAEKVSIFSNIEGGLGMAYGKTIVRDTIFIDPDIFGF